MNTCINIVKALELVNKRNTTVDQLCKFIYKDIQAYQDTREEFYLQEFKDQHNGKNLSKNLQDVAEDCASFVLNKILKDTKIFSIKYSNESMDLVLDAMNQKRFKTAKGSESLLILLSTLKEMNEKEEDN
mgnify:CR=1 FL=1|jgi:hypothetical protein